MQEKQIMDGRRDKVCLSVSGGKNIKRKES
jgi:hypothetical protein